MIGGLMSEKWTWILEGFLLFGLVCMFLADNKGLWLRPKSRGANDDSYREIRAGKLVVSGKKT
jgi:hypothetical protein